MKRIKVIKDYKGLKIGDILTMTEDSYTYKLTKEDIDISETTSSKKITRFEIAEYTLRHLKDIFVEIDSDNNEVEVVNLTDNTLLNEAEYKEDFKSETSKETIEALKRNIEELEDKLKANEISSRKEFINDLFLNHYIYHNKPYSLFF